LNAPKQITCEKREPVPFAPPWPTPDERRSTGKARRGSMPRSTHAEWKPPANRADPIDLLEKSNRTRLTHLVPIRYGRMLDSPFTFLRGAAIVMAADLATTPVTGFRAQLCGDAHLRNFGVYANGGRERLRPVDYSTLALNQDYDHYQRGFWLNYSFFKPLVLSTEINWGQATNYDTAVGPPVLAKANNIQFQATVRPVKGLTIDNTYLMTRLRDVNTNSNMFNNHIIRSKWNYQFTRELSLRVIGQYNAVLSNYNPANPQFALSSLPPAKNFNADILLTYFVHPGTAVYLGYNSNLQNLTNPPAVDVLGNLARMPDHFLNDGRQIFVKISYLFQY